MPWACYPSCPLGPLTEGRAQLRRYHQAEELQAQPNLRLWLAVFVGTELKAVEEVG